MRYDHGCTACTRRSRPNVQHIGCDAHFLYLHPMCTLCEWAVLVNTGAFEQSKRCEEAAIHPNACGSAGGWQSAAGGSARTFCEKRGLRETDEACTLGAALFAWPAKGARAVWRRSAHDMQRRAAGV